MADRDMVNFEADVDKLVATWVKDTQAALSKCQDDVYAGSRTLKGKIKDLKAPASAKPGELEKMINRILKEDGARFKDVVSLQLMVKHDTKTGKLTIDGMGHTGSITQLG